MPRHITISRLEYGIVSNWMRFIGIMQIWEIYNSFSLINLSWELWESLGSISHVLMEWSSPLPCGSSKFPSFCLSFLQWCPGPHCWCFFLFTNAFQVSTGTTYFSELECFLHAPMASMSERSGTSRLVWEWGGWDVEERRSWGLSPPISEPVQHFLP